MNADTFRFSNAAGLARFITITAAPVQAETVSAAVQALCRNPDAPETYAALDRVAGEAFPRRGWRAWVVNPRAHLRALAPDLQLQVLRALAPNPGALYG